MANANDDEPWVELRALKGHDGVVISASYSPDGTRIASASSDKTVRVWDAATGACVSTLKGHTDCVLSASYSPDGKRILSSSSDRTMRVWDTTLLEGRRRLGQMGACVLTLKDDKDGVNSASYSPDGMRILSASIDKTVRVWDAATGSCLSTLKGHARCVFSASYSPDGTRIASASRDKTVRVWDTTTGACILTLYGGHTDSVMSVRYSPDGKRILSASSDKTVRVWDAATGACILTLNGHALFSASYSPDGTRIITASRDKTVRVWDAATGVCVSTLKGHNGFIFSASYSPDGTRIVTTSRDKTVGVWIRRGSRAAAGPSSSNIDDVAFAGERNAEEVREAKKQKLGVVDVCASPNNNAAGATAQTPTPDPPPSTHLLPLIQRIVQILCKGARAAATNEMRTPINATIAKVGKGKCDAAKVATYVDTLPQDLTSVTDDEDEDEDEVPPVEAQVIPGLVTTQELHTIATYECSLGANIGQGYPHTFRVLRGKKIQHRRNTKKYTYDDRQEAVRTACMEGLTRTQRGLKLTLDEKVKEYRLTVAPPNNIGKSLASCPEHIDKFAAKRNLKSRGQIMVVVSGSLSLKFDGDAAIVLNAGDGYIADKRQWRTLHQVFVPHGTACERGTWRLF